MKSPGLDRIAAGISLLLLAALGLFTFYLAQVADRDQASRTEKPVVGTDPDYFVERMALLTMNERGEPAYRLEAGTLQHYPADDIAAFESPVMVSLDPSRPRVTITAARGKLLRGGEEAHLEGDVVLTRGATEGSAPMKAETDFAIVLPDEDIVRTDRPVTVIQGGSSLAGVGMELNNRTRQLRVDSRVKAVLQPPAAPPPADARAAPSPR